MKKLILLFSPLSFFLKEEEGTLQNTCFRGGGGGSDNDEGDNGHEGTPTPEQDTPEPAWTEPDDPSDDGQK